MLVLVKIAYRNLREHRSKTIIIGSLVALGTVILVVGNSALETATRGIEANYTENYTGHVIVAAGGTESPVLTPDVEPSVYEEATPVISRYPEAIEFLRSYPGVRAVNPMITGMALAQQDGEGFGLMQFYGVSPGEYRGFFPDNLEIVDGRFLRPNEEGVVISEWTLQTLADSTNREIGVGDEILLTAPNPLYGVRIREVAIVGVFSFRNASLPLRFISFVDLENARVLNGMTGVADPTVDLTDEELAGLGSVDEDELFGGSFLAGTPAPPDPAAAAPASVDDYLGILGDAVPVTRSVDENAWHYVLIKLDDASSAARVARELNTAFAERAMDLVAFGWSEGAGQVAGYTLALKTVFNVLVVLVAAVAVIIIMNTLVISVTERIAEIGTMRAIGAQKRFVRAMILLETLMIAGVFGAAGVALGAGITALLGAIGLESDNMIVQILMGGPTLHPVVSAGAVGLSLVALLASGALASIYPTAVALRIPPVTAMSAK